MKPETGKLGIAKLGGEKDCADLRLKATIKNIPDKLEPTGWTRLDPTSGLKATSAEKNDKNYMPYTHR